VQFCSGKAGSKPVAGQDDGLDLCLAQARLVVIGPEERARPATRHLSSCNIKEKLMAEPRSAKRRRLWRFCGFQSQSDRWR